MSEFQTTRHMPKHDAALHASEINKVALDCVINAYINADIDLLNKFGLSIDTARELTSLTVCEAAQLAKSGAALFELSWNDKMVQHVVRSIKLNGKPEYLELVDQLIKHQAPNSLIQFFFDFNAAELAKRRELLGMGVWRGRDQRLTLSEREQIKLVWQQSSKSKVPEKCLDLAIETGIPLRRSWYLIKELLLTDKLILKNAPIPLIEECYQWERYEIVLRRHQLGFRSQEVNSWILSESDRERVISKWDYYAKLPTVAERFIAVADATSCSLSQIWEAVRLRIEVK
ncbi:STY4526/YPO1902 family pathogenicity island replication protein [Hahella ganghwensis]|uniref:STY4526/YPO1902 family pathogenicity island replication protein n=1 Tax=Hahella ganghwensis TaxID=286420 RepID=UPI00036132CE|nr:STY4526/YPO1902 family pathogenicity island replication protein [Hahella ganghwensis]